MFFPKPCFCHQIRFSKIGHRLNLQNADGAPLTLVDYYNSLLNMIE